MAKSVNLLLPIKSEAKIGKELKEVTTLRMKKKVNEKAFEISLFNKEEKVEKIKLNKLNIRLKASENMLILEILNKDNVVMFIRGSKFLEDLELKAYIDTLII